MLIFRARRLGEFGDNERPYDERQQLIIQNDMSSHESTRMAKSIDRMEHSVKSSSPPSIIGEGDVYDDPCICSGIFMTMV